MANPSRFKDSQWKCPSDLQSATFDGNGYAGGVSRAGIINLVAEGKEVKVARGFFATTTSSFKDVYESTLKLRKIEVNNILGRMKDAKHGAALAFAYYVSKGQLSLPFIEENSTIAGPELAVACAKLGKLLNAPRFVALMELEFKNIWCHKGFTVDQTRLMMTAGDTFRKFLYEWTMIDEDAQENKRRVCDRAEVEIPSYSGLILGEWHKRYPAESGWLYRPPPRSPSPEDEDLGAEPEGGHDVRTSADAGGEIRIGQEQRAALTTQDLPEDDNVHESILNNLTGGPAFTPNDDLDWYQNERDIETRFSGVENDGTDRPESSYFG